MAVHVRCKSLNILCRPLQNKASVRGWTNDKCLETKHHQTLFGDQTFYRLDTLFGAV